MDGCVCQPVLGAGLSPRSLRSHLHATTRFGSRRAVQCSAKFAPFVSQPELASFRYEAPARHGRGRFRAAVLGEAQLMKVADILVESFAESLGYPPVFRRFLHQRIQQYLQKNRNLLPKTVILAGELSPPSAPQLRGEASSPELHSAAAQSSSTAPGPGASPRPAAPSSLRAEDELDPPELRSRPAPEGAQQPLEESRSSSSSSNSGGAAAVADPPGPVVGTVEISFSDSTRVQPFFMKAPLEQPYVCNLGVAEAQRRRGYGSQLMAAAEELARQRGFREVYLHLRLVDEPALALYRKAGYEVFGKEPWLARLLLQEPRYLMRKHLA